LQLKPATRKYIVTKEYKFKVKIFRAIDHPKLCDDFTIGHKKVLEDFGVKNVTSDNPIWRQNPNTFCITYQSSVLGMVGGIRLEVASERFELPIFSAVGKKDPTLKIGFEKYQILGLGEVCGMWTDRRVAGIGVGNGLVRFAFLTLRLSNTSYGLCLVTDYTKMLVMKYGFEVAEKFGKNGTFEYPDSRYLATVMVLNGAINNKFKSEFEAETIDKLIEGEREILESFDNHRVKLELDICFDID
jgi:hypothetical protein